MRVIPLGSVPSALVKLFAWAFRHPNRDADIVVFNDGHVEIEEAKRSRRPGQAPAH